MALPYHLYVISTQVPNVDEKIRYGTALVFLALVLIYEFRGYIHPLSIQKKEEMVKISVKDLNIWFDDVYALKNVSLEIHANEILSVIGPANSGKTTFLRMLNRLNELELRFRMNGEIKFDGDDLGKINIEQVRRKVGMVFAMPLPLPLSIFDNVAYGAKMHGTKRKNNRRRS